MTSNDTNIKYNDNQNLMKIYDIHIIKENMKYRNLGE